MLVRTDDEVYRVDAVWLGPPRATFPWRARYVSYGVGLLVIMLIMMVQRRLGIGLDFFSVAWALVGTVAITRLLGKKIDYERPLGQVLGQFWAEVTGPRAGRRPAGGSVHAGHVRVSGSRGPAGRAKAVESEPWRSRSRRDRAVTGGSARATGSGPAVTSGPFGKPVATKGPLGDRGAASAAPALPGGTSGSFGKPVATRGALGPPASAAPVGVQPGAVSPTETTDPEPAEPQRVVPPLPEPGSAPKRSRLRTARGRLGGGSRTTANPARTRRPEPWRKGGHRGRT